MWHVKLNAIKKIMANIDTSKENRWAISQTIYEMMEEVVNQQAKEEIEQQNDRISKLFDDLSMAQGQADRWKKAYERQWIENFNLGAQIERLRARVAELEAEIDDSE